jgi:hypothetical protein
MYLKKRKQVSATKWVPKKPGRRQTFITGGWPPNMRTRESAAEYGRCP